MQLFLLNYMKLAFAHVHYFLGSGEPWLAPETPVQIQKWMEDEGNVLETGEDSIFNFSETDKCLEDSCLFNALIKKKTLPLEVSKG